MLEPRRSRNRHILQLDAARGAKSVTYVLGTFCYPCLRAEQRKNGEPGGTRTRDHRIKSAMLYQLSYRPNEQLTGSLQTLCCVRSQAWVTWIVSCPCMTSLLAKV